MFHKSFSINC